MEGKCALYRRASFGLLNDLNHGSKKLSISSFDITNGTLVYFNVGTAADMAISKAIRMSSSIPLIFEPVEYK
jgi:predicted acylesterase/phospholipase RssA